MLQNTHFKNNCKTLNPWILIFSNVTQHNWQRNFILQCFQESIGRILRNKEDPEWPSWSNDKVRSPSTDIGKKKVIFWVRDRLVQFTKWGDMTPGKQWQYVIILINNNKKAPNDAERRAFQREQLWVRLDWPWLRAERQERLISLPGDDVCGEGVHEAGRKELLGQDGGGSQWELAGWCL